MNRRIKIQKVRTAMYGRGSKKAQKVRHITENEFCVFFGILLAARSEGKVGNMWENESNMADRGVKPCTDYTKYMGHRRFKDVRTYMFFVLQTQTKKEQMSGGIS